MKIIHLFSAATLLFCSILPTPARSQEPVQTGTVVAVSPEQGTLTLRSENGKPVMYHGMGTANIQMADGKVATMVNVAPGMMATVFYKQQGNQMLVSKMLIQQGDGSTTGNASGPGGTVVAPGAASAAGTGTAVVPATGPLMPAAGLTPGTVAGQTSRAATDRDITTQPGSKAATDRDITTQPGSKAATDNDITTQPANSGKGGAIRNNSSGR